MKMEPDGWEYVCPVCHEVPPAEILQCRNGHSVCGTCFASLTTLNCPVCREEYGTDRIRNRALEEMLFQRKHFTPAPTYRIATEVQISDSIYSAGEIVRQLCLSAQLLDVFSASEEKQGFVEAKPNEHYKYEGSQTVVYRGNGGFLEMTGSGNVQFIGTPQGVTHSGSGIVGIEGNVNGSLVKTSSGSLFVHGDINGNVEYSGSGIFMVQGNFTGNILATGSGTLSFLKSVTGSLVKGGTGFVRVCGCFKGTMENTGTGTIFLKDCN